MPAQSVAVVIPTLNEESSLRRCLEAVAADADDVVVTDGGSRDATCRIASELGARIVIGSPGRGPQLNRGASSTRTDILVFVHADSILPAGAIERIRQAVSRGHPGGGFLVSFDDPARIFSLGSTLVNARTRLTRIPLGDQAQFVTRETFERLGGFRDWTILEDLDFGRRLKTQGTVAIIDSPVLTASRRYRQNGISRTIANNWWIWFLYLLGVPPADLAKRYRDIR